ncbi:MAG: hypothetical protein ACHQYQ_07690 [Bacteriovoracales bacterium]
MRKYLAAIMTGMLLLGSSPALFAGSNPRTVDEKRMQADYQKRKAETKAYRANLKKQQDSINAMKKSKKK